MQKLEADIKELEDGQVLLEQKLSAARARARKSEKARKTAEALSETRLHRARDAEMENDYLRDMNIELEKTAHKLNVELAKLKEIMSKFGPKTMKRSYVNGRGGGQWEWWVVELIIELLVAGVAPAAIPDAIVVMYSQLYGQPPKQKISNNFAQQCRTVAENLGDYLVAIKLAKEESWDQWFGDATSARNITFSSLALGCLGADFKMDMTYVSSAIFLLNETAETVSETWLNKVCSWCHMHLSYTFNNVYSPC